MRGEQTIKTCADELGLTANNVRSRNTKALDNLYHMKKIRDYYDDIRSRGMRGTGVSKFMETGSSATEFAALWLVSHPPVTP